MINLRARKLLENKDPLVFCGPNSFMDSVSNKKSMKTYFKLSQVCSLWSTAKVMEGYARARLLL